MELNKVTMFRTVALKHLTEELFSIANKRIKKHLDSLYTKQLRIHPSRSVGFRYKSEVYSMVKSEQEFPSRFARLDSSLIDEFLPILDEIEENNANQLKIKNYLTSALSMARTVSDVKMLLPESLYNMLPDQLDIKDEPRLSYDQVMAFQEEHVEEVRIIREQLVCNTLDA